MTKIQNSKQYDLEERTLEFEERINPLLQETTELVKIFAVLFWKIQNSFEFCIFSF